MNDDWLMRQIENVAQGIGMILKKEISSLDLGVVQDQEGNSYYRKSLLEEYLNETNYQEAFLLINSLKFKMSFAEHQRLSNWFIEYLINENEFNEDKDLNVKIEEYRNHLNDIF